MRAKCTWGRDIQIYEIWVWKQSECSQLSQAAKLPTRQILAEELYGSDWAWKCNWEIIIARRLQIATSTAHRIFKHFEESGDIAPSKQCSRLHSRKLNEHHELLIIEIVMENPCVYLQEVRQRIEEATRTQVSVSTVCRICEGMVTQGRKYSK